MKEIPLELNFDCPACKKGFALPVDHNEDVFTCPRCQRQLPLTPEMRAQLSAGRVAQHLVRNQT